MKILIVNPPFYRLQGESLIHYPPGCCYVAAMLKDAGYNPLIYNADYDRRKKTILGNTNHINVERLLSQNEVYLQRLCNERDPVWLEVRSQLLRYDPDVLFVSVFSTTLTAGTRIAAIAKELNPNIHTIFEGCFNRGLHCAVDPSESGDFSVMDFAIRKEPEFTSVELVNALADGHDTFYHIDGLTWRENGGNIVRNPDREVLIDLDQLPFPARECIEDYEKMPPHCFQGIYGSRGCPFDCVFCGCHTSMGYKPRVRSAKNMVEEIEWVHRCFGTRYFYICDDIFFIQKSRAQEFCRRLIDKKLNIYWSAQTRAEMADDSSMALAKEAGCQHIAVGVEVGNPEVRKLIRKGNTVDDVKNCASILHKHGLRLVAFTIIGFPWEGPKEIEDTVNLIKEIKPHIVYPYMPTPAAGTELARKLLEKNPDGFEKFRDICHIDSASLKSERMGLDKKKEVIAWAMGEFVKVNKKNLFKDFFSRPGFYYALAHDMNFFRQPGLLVSYIKDCFPS